MKVVSLVLTVALALAFSGCATFQRAEVIETDKFGGFASGEYRDNSNGRTVTVALAGSGAGWATAGGGFGAFAFSVKTGPPPSGAYQFAKSIAMINYSKKLKSIKYDEMGGIIQYEFEQRPLSRSSSGDLPAAQSALPKSFGHQPVE